MGRNPEILDTYKPYLGHVVSIDEEVYRSEKATGHRNRAIAYLLHNSGIIERDPDGLLDLYVKQCSILVDCRDLALMAATLGNDGVNPIIGVRALPSPFVPRALSVMSSCGMYDYSGAWIYEVGMAAKSAVGGGVMGVLPGQLGLAVFSPKLDEHGNSLRGIEVCKRWVTHSKSCGAKSIVAAAPALPMPKIPRVIPTTCSETTRRRNPHPQQSCPPRNRTRGSTAKTHGRTRPN